MHDSLMHPLIYYVEAARTQLGSMRPDDPDEADFWDGLTAVETQLRAAAAEGGAVPNALPDWYVQRLDIREAVTQEVRLFVADTSEDYCAHCLSQPGGPLICCDGYMTDRKIIGKQAAVIERILRVFGQFTPTDSGAGRDGWLPIESAPKTGSILVTGGTWSAGDYSESPFRGVCIVLWYVDHWRGDDLQSHDEWMRHKPTHWRPLPPPKDTAIAGAAGEG